MMRLGVEPHPPSIAFVIDGINDVIAIPQNCPSDREEPAGLWGGSSRSDGLGGGLSSGRGEGEPGLAAVNKPEIHNVPLALGCVGDNHIPLLIPIRLRRQSVIDPSKWRGHWWVAKGSAGLGAAPEGRVEVSRTVGEARSVQQPRF